MAAFSYSHLPPFLADSVFLPNTPHKTSSFSPDIYSDFSHQFCPSGSVFHEETSIVDASEHKSGSVEVANEPSVTQKQRISETSSMLDNKAESGEQVTQNWAPLYNKRKPSDGSSSNSANSKDVRGGKWKKQKKSHKETKDEHEEKKEEKKTNEVVSKGYIHVRARRGQATDSHSLAERVRREKISERMKMLQALVPGCDKVTGKALMLDEIINYVQSLQHQVEFLSMKLASLNPIVYNFELTEPDAVIVATQGINCNTTMAMPLQSMPPCTTTSAAHATAFSNAITTTTTTTATASFPSAASECPLVDNTSSLFQREEKPTALPLQDIGAFYWELDGQRQNFMNQLYGFQGVNLHSVQ